MNCLIGNIFFRRIVYEKSSLKVAIDASPLKLFEALNFDL